MLLAFEPHEWELLTRLPARVMIAATSAEPDSDRRTVDEGLAGINAIAAGAASDSDLVKAVVGAIYAEADPDPPAAEQFRDRAGRHHRGIGELPAAALVLDSRATPADALGLPAAGWSRSRTRSAARPAPAACWASAGVARSPAEQRFLADLLDALRNV